MNFKQGSKQIEWGHKRKIPPRLCVDRSDPHCMKPSTDLPAELHTELAEQSYRRGTVQGASYILRMFQDGVPLRKIEAYYHKLVMWRHHEPLTKTIFPPMPPTGGNHRG